MFNRPSMYINLALTALVILAVSPAVQGVQCVKAKVDLVQQEDECLCPSEDVRMARVYRPSAAAMSDVVSKGCCEQCIDLRIGAGDLKFTMAAGGASNLKDLTATALHMDLSELQRVRLLLISDRGSVTYSPGSKPIATPLRI